MAFSIGPERQGRDIGARTFRPGRIWGIATLRMMSVGAIRGQRPLEIWGQGPQGTSLRSRGEGGSTQVNLERATGRALDDVDSSEVRRCSRPKGRGEDSSRAGD